MYVLVSGSQTMNIVYAQLKLVVDNEVVRNRTSPNNRFSATAQEWNEHSEEGARKDDC